MTPERRNKIIRVLNHRQPDLTVVFENVHDPHNIAAVMRTCDAIGVQDIYVVNAKADQAENFGKRSSASAANWLTIHYYNNAKDCFEAVKSRYANIYATHLGEKAKSLYELDLSISTALVFGNEHAGVSEETLKYCDGNFIIPQVGMVQSLNISVACAVSLYEAFRQRKEKGYYNAVSRLQENDFKTLSERWGLTDE